MSTVTKRPFHQESAQREFEFEAQLWVEFRTRRKEPHPHETWFGVIPETEHITLTIIDVHADEPAPYVEVFSRQLGHGAVRLAVFGRYFERKEDLG